EQLAEGEIAARRRVGVVVENSPAGFHAHLEGVLSAEPGDGLLRLVVEQGARIAGRGAAQRLKTGDGNNRKSSFRNTLQAELARDVVVQPVALVVKIAPHQSKAELVEQVRTESVGPGSENIMRELIRAGGAGIGNGVRI